jgi:hypothetical protein
MIKKFSEYAPKVIMNIFVCRYTSSDSYWKECVVKLREVISKLPHTVQHSSGNPFGLGAQILLDSDIEESIKISEEILDFFPNKPLIVLSEVNVEVKDLNIPIGEYQDNDLVEPGRKFDLLISENKSGIFVI